jgi:hypothetical protein
MKVIHFKDEGQDFTEWVVGDDNIVIESWPFQTAVWKGTVILDPIDKIEKGDQITISSAHENRVGKLRERVESIEDRPGVPADYTFTADFDDFTVFFKGKPITGTVPDKPLPRGAEAERMAAQGKKREAMTATNMITAIIMGRDKTHDKILYQYAKESR